MTSSRKWCTGHWPVHSHLTHVLKHSSVAAGLLLAAAPLSLALPAAAAAQTVVPAQAANQSVADFYRGRRDAPLWLSPQAGDAAQQLISLLSSASIDGLAPVYYSTELQQALAKAQGGKRKDVLRADQLLSQAFTAYVRDLRQDPGVGITWVDPSLKPTPPTPLASLLTAAVQPSLSAYVHAMGWMHPYYAELREALADHKYTDDAQRQIIELNLKRVRILPPGKERYILVNAAQQRLYMYENGKPVDSMVVVVGKPKWPTPMLAAYIRFAALNPYWYVPSDLAGEDVGQYVLKFGLKYLDDYGYKIVSDWSRDPKIIDPKTVDWKGVVDGKVDVMIRQDPGPKNFMGRIKFMFPNQFGVYLHDNPRRELFQQSVRYFSGGCVRLEDAWRLSKWLFHRELTWEGHGTEEPVMLDQPVPVYITYMTAVPDGQSIAYFDDAYGRDAAKVATADSNSGTASGSR
ncbi:MAG: L,D-transpeptidase family protein [Myxococcales bacterium]